MTRTGRPLRFLAMTLVGWTAVRTMLLWPEAGSVPALVRALLPPPAAAEPLSATRTDNRVAITRWDDPGLHVIIASRGPEPGAETVGTARGRPAMIALALVGLIRLGDAQAEAATGARNGPQGAQLAPALAGARPSGSRLSGSAWLVARGGGLGSTGFGGGQLGGSQAGARLVYALDRERHIAVVASLSAPLHGIGREAAIGFEWRPSRLPVRLVAEERIALDRGRSGPAIGAVAGIGPVSIGGGFRLEAYGQAGAIDRDTVEGFADGAVRVARPIATLGRIPIDLGGGIWGGAQRDAARLDVGPSIGATLPIGRQPVRIALDWRERIAGQARPGSGVALTLGTDF